MLARVEGLREQRDVSVGVRSRLHCKSDNAVAAGHQDLSFGKGASLCYAIVAGAAGCGAQRHDVAGPGAAGGAALPRHRRHRQSATELAGHGALSCLRAADTASLVHVKLHRPAWAGQLLVLRRRRRRWRNLASTVCAQCSFQYFECPALSFASTHHSYTSRQVNKTMRELNHPGARSPSRTGTPPVGGRSSPALKDALCSPGDSSDPAAAVNKPLAAVQAAGKPPQAGSPLGHTNTGRT